MNKVDKVYQEFIESYTKLMKQNAPKSSGALSNSIEGYREGDDVIVTMLSYGEIVDKGINGIEKNYGSPYSFSKKKPPISSLLYYSATTGINPYALQNSIFRNGFKAQPFIEQQDEIIKFANNLAEALWDDFTENQNKQ